MRARTTVAAAVAMAGTMVLSTAAAQNLPAGDIRITRAIFGATQGSADVTPTVTRLVTPSGPGLYAAPQWLGVGPASGQTKQLVIFFEYRGEPHVLTVTEPHPVTHAILVAHASPPARRAAPAAGVPLEIVDAHYGMGRTFTAVTTRVRELVRAGAPALVVNDDVLGLPAAPQARVLIVTYTYGGDRQTAVLWRGSLLNYEDLVRTASARPVSSIHTDEVPDWLSTARPDPPRPAGTPEPGTGQSPRRELGIVELLKALAELRAIAPAERTGTLTGAILDTQRALDSAQREIPYRYPPPGSPSYVAREEPAAVHLAKATASLNSAMTHLSNANTSRRGNPVMAATLAAIRAALLALNGVAGG